MPKENNGGRPSKIQEEMTIRFAVYLAGEGKTDVEIAEYLGITERTLNNWKHTHAQFFQSLKDAKRLEDAKVEKSLFERALGYSHPEEKLFFDSKVGEVVSYQTTKHYPPDPTSMIFWLKNRQPKLWRDKPSEQDEGIQEMTFDGDDSGGE